MNAHPSAVVGQSGFKGKLRDWARARPGISRTFHALRYEWSKGNLREKIHVATAGHLVRKARIAAFLRHDGPKLLQVGGGYHLKPGADWLNADLLAGDIYLNAVKRLPFPDNSIDAIFTEQFIEHLPQWGGHAFMKEAYRVLKPGGIIRQSTPDLNKLIAVYRDEANGVARETVVDRHINNHRVQDPMALRNACQFVNDQFRLWGHQFIYDEESMRALTEAAGFTDFKWCRFGESQREDLSNMERHADSEWMKSEISMFYEARKA